MVDSFNKQHSITEENIRCLVDSFYAKVRVDTLLNPIFSKAIGEDIKMWQPHLQIMYDFWSSLMLSSNRYKGNPFQKHIDLSPFDMTLFDTWLRLFEETAREIYIEDLANQYIEKSKRIAGSLKAGLYFMLQKAEEKTFFNDDYKN
ncbi:MAG: group III truncated hemoglobin [Candidatus Nucleicultricaceae bacterium]